jgi:hypothetical protein
MELTIDERLKAFVHVGLCIENLTWTPEVIIRNSHFERTNTRGLLLTTRRKVIVEKNAFYRTGMFPILIADDASNWFESGAVQDVTIRDNTFVKCGYNSGSGAIKIAPENHELLPGNMVHRNISIVNNTFTSDYATVLMARSTDRLVFSGNKILYADFLKGRKEMISVDVIACSHVRIEKNSFDLPETPVIRASKMTSRDLYTDLKVGIK